MKLTNKYDWKRWYRQGSRLICYKNSSYGLWSIGLSAEIIKTFKEYYDIDIDRRITPRTALNENEIIENWRPAWVEVSKRVQHHPTGGLNGVGNYYGTIKSLPKDWINDNSGGTIFWEDKSIHHIGLKYLLEYYQPVKPICTACKLNEKLYRSS